MSYNRTPLQIIAGGIDQAIQFGAPTDMIARLRGAMAYAEQTGTVLLEETRAIRKAGSIAVGHIIPELEQAEVE